MQNMPDFTDMMRIIQTPEGRKLMAMLQNADANVLHTAMTSAKSGDYNAAKGALSSILSTPEAQALLKQLGR